MDVSCAVVAIGMGDDQGLMSGEEVFRELPRKVVSLLHGQSVILRVPWVEADDVVVRHDVALAVVLVELMIQLDTLRVEGVR